MVHKLLSMAMPKAVSSVSSAAAGGLLLQHGPSTTFACNTTIYSPQGGCAVILAGKPLLRRAHRLCVSKAKQRSYFCRWWKLSQSDTCLGVEFTPTAVQLCLMAAQPASWTGPSRVIVLVIYLCLWQEKRLCSL